MIRDLGWGHLVAGFAGVMLVVRPDFRDLQLGHLAALVREVRLGTERWNPFSRTRFELARCRLRDNRHR